MKWRPNPKATAAAIAVVATVLVAKAIGADVNTVLLCLIAFTVIYADMRAAGQ